MKRLILDGIELVIARNDPLLGAAHIELEDRGQEMPGVDQLVQFAIGERDRRGGIAAPVDHAWNTAFTAHAAGGPLACPVAHRGVKSYRSGHLGVPEIAMLTYRASAPPRVPEGRHGIYNGAPARMQCFHATARAPARHSRKKRACSK